jgi:hypothetical protein
MRIWIVRKNYMFVVTIYTYNAEIKLYKWFYKVLKNLVGFYLFLFLFLYSELNSLSISNLMFNVDEQ